MPTRRMLKKQENEIEQRLADMFADSNFDEDYIKRHDLWWEPLIGWKPWFETVVFVWVAMRIDIRDPLPGHLYEIASLKDSRNPSYMEAREILKSLYRSYVESRGND